MNNLTLLETILITYVLLVNILGVIGLIVVEFVSGKTWNAYLVILVGVAIPIIIPIILYTLIFDKLKRGKKKHDLEKQFEEMIKENKK
jgi:phosphotransferase system  glucose/maltose/N-acetylglucosamine-specific IIC component